MRKQAEQTDKQPSSVVSISFPAFGLLPCVPALGALNDGPGHGTVSKINQFLPQVVLVIILSQQRRYQTRTHLLAFPSVVCSTATV